jgi:hypothetical protein
MKPARAWTGDCCCGAVRHAGFPRGDTLAVTIPATSRRVDTRNAALCLHSRDRARRVANPIHHVSRNETFDIACYRKLVASVSGS